MHQRHTPILRGVHTHVHTRERESDTHCLTHSPLHSYTHAHSLYVHANTGSHMHTRRAQWQTPCPPWTPNTQAQSSSSHTLRPRLLTASSSLSLKSSPDVSFPFRGQRKLNQICPQGSLFDGEIGEESGEEPGRRGRGGPPSPTASPLGLHIPVGCGAETPSQSSLRGQS